MADYGRGTAGIGYDPTSGATYVRNVLERKKEIELKERLEWTLGLTFLFAAVLLYGLASVMQKFLYNGEDLGSPFFLTYVTTGIFVLFIPFNEFNVRMGYTKRARTGYSEGFWNRWRKMQKSWGGYTAVNTSEEVADDDSSSIVGHHPIGEDSHKYTNEYTHWDALEIGFLLAPIWFFGNLAYNYSLKETTISSNTILSNLSASFTLIVGAMLGAEKITKGKVLGVLISLAGCLIIVFFDETASGDDDTSIGASDQRLLGDLLAVVGALCYGLYTPLLSIWVGNEDGIPDEQNLIQEQNQTVIGMVRAGTVAGGLQKYTGPKRIPMSLVLGNVGLVVCAGCTPVSLIFGLFCYEDICNISFAVVGTIVVLAFMNSLVAEYMWARSIVLTTPAVATVGLGLGTPLSMAIDWVLGTSSTNGISSIIGASLTIVGFLVVQIGPEEWESFFVFVRRCFGIDSKMKNPSMN